jgi:hypothetical protein
LNKGFYVGAIATLLLFLAANLVAAQLQSDCGIRAVIGLWVPGFSACNDDIVRLGFPFQFLEQGGFAFRSIFNLGALLADAIIAFCAGVLVGLIAQRRVK